MSRLKSAHDECIVLVKALPHRSSSYFETVCCAGVGRDHKWRRLYPVPFRVLSEAQQFGRWNWVKYQYTSPAHDGRRESQKVVPETISVGNKIRDNERSRVACAMTRESLAEAESKSETLTLLKPTDLTLSWAKKTADEINDERRKHADLVSQLSFLDAEAKPLEPCPYEFSFKWRGVDGVSHKHTCDDWETSTAFFRRRAKEGEEGALRSLKDTYENVYPAKGMRFALGTHSRRIQQWLLVGILRVDEDPQRELSW